MRGALLLWSACAAAASVCLLVRAASAATTQASTQATDCAGCTYGRCDRGKCVCNPGFTGENCTLCTGRVRLNDTEGFITSGVGNYSQNMKCTWLIDVVGDGSKQSSRNRSLRLRLNRFETECGWDHLYVFDGDSMFGQMIAAYSGLLVPEGGGEKVTDLVAHSGRAFVHFFSDAVYNMSGFQISYSVDQCADDCNDHGECDVNRGVCNCRSAFKGETCNIPVATKTPSRSSTANLYRIAGGSVAGRAMHQALVYNHSMWVFGGEFFSSILTQRRQLEVARFDFATGMWNEVQMRGANIPPNTYGHSIVAYKNSLYMYGGAHTFDENNVTNALWRFDPQKLEWAQVSHIEARDNCQHHILCPPVPSVGHAAVMVNQSMLVFFGHHPTLGYLNLVQEYRIGSVNWELVKTTGAVIKGGFGQTAVYDERSQQVLIFGGYHSQKSTGAVVDYLYSYRPSKRSWTILRPSGMHRYLHSAVIIDGVMLVFGGNTHNDTSYASGDRCFSADTLAYDIECDLWQTVKIKESATATQGFRRFGHSAVSYNSSMYIFGGFNGRMLADTLKLTPAHCEALLEKECLSMSLVHGTKCISAAGEGCMRYNSENLKGYPQKKGANCSWINPSSLPLNFTHICAKQTNCGSCLQNSLDCVWCENTCHYKKCPKQSPSATVKHRVDQCTESESYACDKLHNCHACHTDQNCAFKKNNGCINLIPVNAEGNKTTRSVSEEIKAECEKHCSEKTDCNNCTSNSGCMWCANLGRCLETNAYAAMFPVGQCTEWSTSKCDKVYCSRIRSCSECLQHERCGWCDDGSGTGRGKCMEGAATGPVATGIDAPVNGSEMSPQCLNWHFLDCPSCQCNGHSTCLTGTPECIQPCAHNTQGNHCERCQKGFYGSPVNGGTCQTCKCNGHGTDCHHETGKCDCTTKGIIGKQCDQCDNTNQYWGNPGNGGTCFYKLSIDFQYTFNLSHEDPFTSINFMNMPPRVGHDVEFQISCSTPALVNISIGVGAAETTGDPRNPVPVSQTRTCGSFKMPLSHEEYKFGTRNATLYVHVFNLTTPAVIQVAFSQHRALDLLQFFITFSSCFVSLLFIAAVLWKIKQKYDLYRRRQQLFVEMEQMASRPFAGVTLELQSPPYGLHGHGGFGTLHQGRPTPVALEPCASGKAAVISLIVRLPRQDSSVPQGQSGIAIASALVSLSQLGGKGQQNTIRENEHKGDCWKPNTNVGTCL